MRIFLLICIVMAYSTATTELAQAKQPTNMKGFIKVAQKAYPGHCTGHIKVRWGNGLANSDTCEIWVNRKLYKASTNEWRCNDVGFSVGQLEGEVAPDFPKACKPNRRKMH